METLNKAVETAGKLWKKAGLLAVAVQYGDRDLVGVRARTVVVTAVVTAAVLWVW